MQQMFVLVLQSGHIEWVTFRMHFILISVETLTVVTQDLSFSLTLLERRLRKFIEEAYTISSYKYLQVQSFLLL
jgi:hypothetical protein